MVPLARRVVLVLQERLVPQEQQVFQDPLAPLGLPEIKDNQDRLVLMETQGLRGPQDRPVLLESQGLRELRGTRVPRDLLASEPRGPRVS